MALEGSGGWSDKLIGEYLDQRKKYRILGAKSASEAVEVAEQCYEELRGAPSQTLRHFGAES